MLKKQYLKNKATCKVTFTLPLEAAPDAKEVKILGDFNGWSWQEGTPMKRTKTEYSTVLELETGRRYEFRYLIDNDKWENDWAADDYAPTTLGAYNSVVEVSTPLETGNPTEEIQEKAKSQAIKQSKVPQAAKATRPTTKKATQRSDSSVKDDLTRIEGIGPKLAQVLNERGIMTFVDLARMNPNVLKTMLAEAGSRNKMHDPTTWAEQAQLAAIGNWDALSKLQLELKKGKR
jgi:predicted flap endonuclease-1-like 5' DNA nuclease